MPLQGVDALFGMVNREINLNVPSDLRPLLSQYDFGVAQLLDRLAGMTDEEYLWEPVTGCWSIRPRTESQSNAPVGGDWVLDLSRPEPDPPPFTTIAWRLTHLSSSLAARADYTTGSRSLTRDDLVIARTAAGAIEYFRSASSQWKNALESAGDEHIHEVGYSQLPWGLDPQMPFIEIAWWVNKELIQHGAEVATLRDLYRAMQ